MADQYVLDVGQTWARYNLMENGSFEINTSGWSTFNTTITRITSDAYAGSASLRATSTSTSNAASAQYPGLPVIPGEAYRLSCWVKNTNGATRNMRVRANWDAGTDADGADVSVTAGGAWTYLSLSGTVPAEASTVTVIVDYQRTSAVIGNIALIDGVMFEQPYLLGGTIPTETFYFDTQTIVGAPATVYNARTQLESLSGDQSICNYETYTLDAVDVQTLSLFLGKRAENDSFTASSGNITSWYPNGFTSPVADLLPGNPCRVRRVGNSTPLWLGRVQDVRVEWGLPWDGSVGNGDTLTVELEGYGGEWGRSGFSGTTGGTVTSNFQYQITPFYANWIAATGYDPEIADTATPASVNNALEWLNYLADTFNATMNDGNPVIQVRAYNSYESPGIAFSMTTNNATNRVYEAIQYSSLADSFYSQVEVVSDVVSAVGYGNINGRAFDVTTLSETQDQADGLVTDLIDKYGQPVYKVTSVSCRAEAQHTMNLDGGANGWASMIGKRTTVGFRGTTTDVRIQGLEITADPSTALYTFYFSAENSVEYFILDSSDYGVLDTNRLGW